MSVEATGPVVAEHSGSGGEPGAAQGRPAAGRASRMTAPRLPAGPKGRHFKWKQGLGHCRWGRLAEHGGAFLGRRELAVRRESAILPDHTSLE